jgi:hypothetical protein|nr:MAG TPA: hypothetical protein [Caudoviricetes sp.]
MRQVKIGKYVGFTDLSDDELFVMLKFDIRMELIFVNFDTKEILKERMKLFARWQINGVQEISGKKYTEIIKFIDDNWDDEFQLVILIDASLINKKKPLLELVTAIPKEIYQSCVAIRYYEKGDIFEIEFLSEPNGYSNKFIYYNSNDTFLILSKDGPKLITDDPSVNNILDVIKKFR